MNRPGGDGGMEDTKEDGEDADYIMDPNHLDNDDIYHLPQYQNQPVDLSLNSEQFDSPNIFFRPGPGESDRGLTTPVRVTLTSNLLKLIIK